MLLQFNFENFRSFKNKASLDMTAAGISEMPVNYVEYGGEKGLLASAIFGANGSGKTNVYEAFACMTRFVLNSLQYGKDHSLFMRNLPEPFLFDENSAKGNTSFEVYFILPDDPHEKTYHYGFSLNKEGIVEEWLNVKAKTARTERVVFYRSPDEIDLGGLKKSEQILMNRSVQKETLLISLGAGLKIDICMKIRNWFRNNRLIDFDDLMRSKDISDILPAGFLTDQKVRNHVVQYLHSFDHSIQGFRIEDDTSSGRIGIRCLHQMEDGKNMAAIPLQNESAGTLKMLAMYQSLLDVLNHGGVFLIDEIDSSLHPLLVRYFVVLFHARNENPNHAQLIFTTHDTFQLSNDAFRRDEIWFAEKDEKGESSLYSLVDFVDADGKHIRKDADYEKNYLYGRYGAIPALDPMYLSVR